MMYSLLSEHVHGENVPFDAVHQHCNSMLCAAAKLVVIASAAHTIWVSVAVVFVCIHTVAMSSMVAMTSCRRAATAAGCTDSK